MTDMKQEIMKLFGGASPFVSESLLVEGITNKGKLRDVIENLYPRLSSEDVSKFVNRYLSGLIDLEGRPLNRSINEGIASDAAMREKFNIMGRADGGRIGFESGTREGRTVGMSKNRVTQLLDLRQEAVDKKDEDKIIEIDQELSMMGFRTSKALGGRIGFQKGRSVQPLQIPQLGTGDMIQYFRDALKQANPNATDEELDDAAEKMFRGELAVKDSKRGLGSMVASADDEDDYKSPPFIDDPEGRMETDPFEMIREALEKGSISELPDSDIYSMYDAAVERGAFDGTFEEFKDMLSQLQQRQRRPEGIMQTMVT